MLCWWLPCGLLVLISVRCLVCTLDFNRLVRWWASTLCLLILRPLRNLLLHRRSRCGQVSLSLFGHNMQLGLVCVWPKEMFSTVAHVLGESDLEEFRDLCVQSLW